MSIFICILTARWLWLCSTYQLQKVRAEVNEMKKTTIMLVALAIVMLNAAVIAAEPIFDAQRSNIGVNDTKDAVGIESLTAYGANITHFNITVEVSTLAWTGLYGMVTNSLLLEGTGDNTFYTWGTQDSTGTVFFSTDNNVDWGSIQAGDQTLRESEDTALGMTGDADAVNNTLTGTNSGIISIGGTDIAATSAPTAVTLSNGGTNWETVLLTDGVDPVYATPIQQDNENYAGDAVDFQTMVPVDTGSGYSRTYYIYAAVA